MPTPHAQKELRSSRLPWKNASAVALTNSIPKEALNLARSSTTGCKLKRRFFGPKSMPVSTKRLKSLSQPAIHPLTSL